jgi:4'-phosphopantetheinyl transferase
VEQGVEEEATPLVVLLVTSAKAPQDEVAVTWVRVDPQPVAATRLLALEVGRIAGTPADEVRVVHSCPRCGSSEHGTPVVVAPREPALSVSLSRAPGAVVVAVSTVGPVGVDLEVPDAARFAGFERVALHEREHAPTVEARATTWVRKESLLKATGQGLHLDPGTIRISGAHEAPRLIEWPGTTRPPAAQMRDLELGGYVACLTVLGEREPRVTVRQEDPAALPG